MDLKLPGIIVTGASGFVGRNFLEAANKKYRLFCIARQSQKQAGIPKYDNILWAQIDIGKFSNLHDVIQSIKNYGGADYILHLAGYYDFTLKDNPEYENSNVIGTRNILELANLLKIKRCLFASSLAACKFCDLNSNEIIVEQSPPDAEFPYARSKRLGEEMMKEYSEKFPCTVIRFAAVYSDWCEYAPLYTFLETWLSHKWNSRIIGGKGESAITYIHINDLIKLFFRIIEISDSLPKFCIYIASPSGTVSHNDLFKAATKYYYGHIIKPFRMPKFLAIPGIIIRSFIGKIIGNEPFERLWMMKYIDKKLIVENVYTNKVLSWRTTQRYDILRRLLFMVEKIKNHNNEWKLRNQIALTRIAQRPNIIVYNLLVDLRDSIINKMLSYILSEQNKFRYSNYQKINKDIIKWHITLLYQLIAITIRTKDNKSIREYAQIYTYQRFLEGFDVEEIKDFLYALVNIINNELLSKPEFKKMKQEIYNYINITVQLTVDEIEDYFELLTSQPKDILPKEKKLITYERSEDLQRLVRQLEDTFYDSIEYPLSKDYLEIYEKILNKENN